MKGEKKIKKIKNWDPCSHPHQCLLGSLWSRLNRTKISQLLALAGLILVPSPYSLLLSSHLGKESEKTCRQNHWKNEQEIQPHENKGGEGMNISLLSEGQKKVEMLVYLVIMWWQKSLHQKVWRVTVVQRHWPCLALHWFTSLSTGKVFLIHSQKLPFQDNIDTVGVTSSTYLQSSAVLYPHI